MKDKRFLDNAEFCPHCLTNDYWYVGGGSWSPDRCPNHRKSDDFILWGQMSRRQRNKAAKIFNNMWFNKYECYYFKEDKMTLYNNDPFYTDMHKITEGEKEIQEYFENRRRHKRQRNRFWICICSVTAIITLILYLL